MTPRSGHDFSRTKIYAKSAGNPDESLSISKPGDVSEQEADRVADEVMRIPSGKRFGRERQIREDKKPEIRVNAQSPLIQREDIPSVPITEGEEKGGLKPADAPTWAVPIEKRLTFDKRTARFKDSGTGKVYTKSQMDKHRKVAGDHEECYDELVKRLTARKPRIKPSDNVQAIVREEFNDIGKCGKAVTGGSAPPTTDKGSCFISLEPNANPFMIFPFWVHESQHQRTCTTTYNAKLKEYKKSGFYQSSGTRGKIIKERLASETESTVTEPSFLIDDEIRSYKDTVQAIHKELESSKTIEQAGSAPPAQKKVIRRFSNASETTTEAKGSVIPPIVHEVLRSPGQPLDAETRAFFEPRFGHDFSQVRVHTDVRTAETADGMKARAYTKGQDVFFGAGEYSPGTDNGRKLIAHELVHVIQQHDISHTDSREMLVQRKVKLRAEKVSCAHYSPDNPIFKEIGTNDPVNQIEIAIERASLLIDKSIEVLQFAQNEMIEKSDSPASEISPETMKIAIAIYSFFELTPNKAGAEHIWKDKGYETVTVIMERLKSAKKILEGGEIFFVCLGKDCDVMKNCDPSKICINTPTPTIPGEEIKPKSEVDPIIIKTPVVIDKIKARAYVTSPRYIIFLCKLWWKDMDLTERAITLIHEALHIYYWGEILDSGPPMQNVYNYANLISKLNTAGP
jgi:hypothetical protein